MLGPDVVTVVGALVVPVAAGVTTAVVVARVVGAFVVFAVVTPDAVLGPDVVT